MLKWILDATAIVIICGMVVIVATRFSAFDDTDNHTTGERSGVSLYTDHLTGCQYLGTLFGGITPRLDQHGNHICEGKR